jgi:hypothetical protein
MQPRIITVDLLYVRQNWTKFDTKHAKRAVSFRLKNNETYETACFTSQRNFAKLHVCFAKHETCFVSCFAKYETKLVSLETLIKSQSLAPSTKFNLANTDFYREAGECLKSYMDT